MHDLTLDILRMLVAHDTTNPPRRITQHGVFADVRDVLAGAGFRSEMYDLGDGCLNLLAVRGSPRGLFNVHLDTVPATGQWSADPFTLRVDDERAVGLGTCDIKGAAACLLAAATSTDGSAAILFTSDEEAGDSRCVRTFLSDRPDFIEHVVVAEPTNCKAVTAHRGLQTCEGFFQGTPGHGSNEHVRSAVHDAASWVDRALQYARAIETEHFDDLHGVRLNVGVIEGGVKANVIAPRARVVFGVRPLPGQCGNALLDDLCALAPPDADVAWQPRFDAPALAPNEDAPIVARQLGMQTGPAVNFWTEAALFAQAGLSAVVFGPGDIAQAHTADEWVALAELERTTALYRQIFADGMG